MLGKKIVDEFSHVECKSRRYQLRHNKAGLCGLCARKKVGPHLCLEHMVAARERQRRAMGNVRRNRKAASYRMEKQ